MSKTLSYWSLLFLLVLFACNSNSQNEINWSDFKIVSYKKVKTNFLGFEEEISLPVFNSEILSKDGETVVIEGYFMRLESLDFQTMKTKEVCLLTISDKPTIVVCGRAQFRQNEFIRIYNIRSRQKQKLKVQGTLRIDQNGSQENLIRLTNTRLIN